MDCCLTGGYDFQDYLPNVRRYNEVMRRTGILSTPKARALMALFDQRMEQLVKSGQLKPIFERWKQPYPFDSN